MCLVKQQSDKLMMLCIVNNTITLNGHLLTQGRNGACLRDKYENLKTISVVDITTSTISLSRVLFRKYITTLQSLWHYAVKHMKYKTCSLTKTIFVFRVKCMFWKKKVYVKQNSIV